MLLNIISINIAILSYIVFTLYYSNKPNIKKSSLNYYQTLPLSLFNLFVCLPFTTFIWNIFFSNTNIIFNLKELLFIIPSIVVGSTIFTLIHYLLHRCKLLYKKIHSIHHKAIITKSFDALYVHSIEFIFGMILPFLFSCYLFNLSFFTSNVVFIISIHENIRAHATYTNIISEHNYHHRLFNVNYDSFPYIFSKYITKSFIKKKYLN